jgi:DNA-binding transcriptional LysR family regulator
MNYRHLQFFAKVVEQGSIKAAAGLLGVAQPTVSSAISKLEVEFGARLLDRRRDGSAPTIYGQAVYDSATTMASVVQNTHDKIADLKDPGRGHVRIGTGPSVAISQVSMSLAQLADRYPDLRISHVNRNTFETLEQLLIVDDIDVALCHVPERWLPKTLDWQLITPNPIVAVAATTHFPPSANSLPTGSMLSDFRWITPHDDEIRPPRGVTVSRYARQFGPPINVVAEDLELIKRMTLTTKSIGFLPMHMVQDELASGQMVELTLGSSMTTRPIYALTRKSSEMPPAIGELLRAAQRVFAPPDQVARVHRTVDLVPPPEA